MKTPKLPVLAVAVATIGILVSQPLFAQASGSGPGASNSDPANSSMPGRPGSSTNAGSNPTIPNSAGGGNASGVPSTGGGNLGSGGSTVPDASGAVRGTRSNDPSCNGPMGASAANCNPSSSGR